MPLDMDEVKSVLTEELKGLLEDRDKKSDDLAEQLDVLKTKSDEDSTDIKTRLDTTTDELKKINETIEAQEKKLARVNSRSEFKTAGQQFIESDEFKERATTSEPCKISFEVKDVLNSGNLATGVSRSVLVPEQQSGFIAPPQISLRIRNLFSVGQTSSNAIRSIKETGYTNNAAPVAEGASQATV